MKFIPFPPWVVPDNLMPSLDGIMERVQTLAGGAVLSVGGVAGLSLIPPKITDKNLKLFTQITFTVMAGYGILQVAKAVGPEIPLEPPEPPEPDETYPLYVAHPTGSDKVYCFRDFDFSTVIMSNYGRRQVYVGMTLRKVGGEEFDYTAQPVILEANSVKEVVWKGQIGCWGPEDWEIIFAVWDVSPYPGCLGAGACHRLGDSGWHRFRTAGFI